MKEIVLIPTVGYHEETGVASTFELEAGAKLPAGYVDTPTKVKPAKKDK